MLFSTGGYAYLAHCRPPERESLIQACLAAPPPALPHGFDRARIDALIDGVLTDGFCNLEFDNFREGNLGVPLLLAGRAVGALVMRYIKSTLHGTDRLRQEFAPRLQRLAEEIAQHHPATRPGWESSSL